MWSIISGFFEKLEMAWRRNEIYCVKEMWKAAKLQAVCFNSAEAE